MGDLIDGTGGPHDLQNANAWLSLLNVEDDPGMADDVEHSLLMQVSGSKTVSIGRFESDTVRRHEFDRYWDGSHGRIETLQPEVASYTMTPGRAVYIPPGTPHWVHNGPDISLSVTLTYFTAATVRENRVESFNAHL
jgi:hypothetical protein